MTLELTEQQLKDLGFKMGDKRSDCEKYTIIYAKKKIKHSEAFFYYFYSFDTKLNEVIDHHFDLLCGGCGDVSTVISNIETLERFHELENVLNKK